MTDTTNQDLHADHRLWLSDLSLWQDDLREWRDELGRALDDLREAEAALRAHAQGLDQHGVAMDQEAEGIRQHECGIALTERAGAGLTAGPHEAQAARHPQRRDAHERLKRYHHTLIARVSLLLKAIREPV
jgi:hypothetical protein